ncbi:MAG: gliding motility-associated C-terminal domain-containing protein [Bacteroidales bacterium]|nr:gliding motility-associated C-terminal domain-containing protein [Bacteroidales bacterium]
MKKYFILTLFISLGYFVNAQTLPTTSDNTVSTSEDLDRVFGVVDFPFVDPDIGASLWQIRITNNVTTGTLYDDSDLDGVIDVGEALGVGDIILVTDFNRFKFKPLPDQNGVGYDQFDFQVHDGADGWSILPASTMTIDVTAVNDDPVVTTNTGKTVAEGATNQVIAQAELETTDLEQAAASLTYTLNSIPVNGTLTNGGPPLGVGGTFTQADINAGNVEYNHDGSETNSDAFTFSVDDGAGGSTPVTAFSITVTPVNDPPVLVNNTGKTVNEGAANQIIPNTELLVTDVDNTNAQIEYTLTTIPTNGTLFCGGALGLGSTFTQANINANMLQYTHDGSETVADLFRFTVSDGAGGNIGLTQFDITITPQNDDPVVTTNNGKTVSEGAANQTILNTELETTDAESGPALLTYTLSAVPANGTLTNGGPPLGIGGTFTQLDINSNNVEYNHDGSETISDSFTFTVDDGTGGTTVATVFVITITPVNDAPVVSINTGKTVNEGVNNAIILNTELRVTDVDNTDAQIEFTVTVVPTNGTLNNNAVPLLVGNTFTQTDINLNNINYSHDGTETVADFFRFTVSDGSGGNIGNTQFDITITPLNDDPVVTTNNGKTVAEGAVNQTILITDLETTDTDNTPAQLTYTLNAAPARGNLTNGGVPILVLGTFTQLDINSNNIEYDHDGSEPNADSFTFTVDDGAGGTTPATTFNITITSVNDAPVLATNNPLNINEGDLNQTIPNTLLEVTDVDNTPAEIEFTLTTAPSSGTLYLSGVPVAVAGTFTQAQINANAITYSHDGSESVADFFRFTVNDGAGGNIGVTQFDINIAPVNDAPVFDTSPVTVGAELVLYTYNISASDPDHPGPALSFAAVTIPPWLALVDNGNGTATLSGTPPGGAPLNNPMSISVTDGTETVFQNWNLMITSGVTANAGLDDTTCIDDSYILNGNSPPVGYTGLWTVIDGAGIFVDPTLYNTQVDGLNSGVAPNNSNTFRWTLSNADGSYVVWDDVVIINNTVISEVTDISNVCGTNAILQADNALFPGESGLWTVEGFPVPLPVIANPTQRTTAVSGLNYNVNQFRWTVTKETCSDFAIMTVNVIEVWATAGGPAEICSEPFTIYGNDPALLGGTGLWTVGAGGGIFANANNPTTTVTGSHQDVTNQYIWTVTVNGCSDQASVFVENNIPSTATITTPDPSTSCDGTYTIVAVPADATDPNETGFWTTVTPGVIIATPNNATTNVTNLQQGANLFTWHITNGNCPESTADLTINYFLPAVVNAGPDDIICTDIYNLAATPLNPGETGLWTVVVGGGTILDPTSSNTQVINIQRGLNTFQWTVNHDICSNSDMVDITNLSVDATIFTGDPDEACFEPWPIQANDPSFYDLANPPTVTTGLWTVQAGGAVVDFPLAFNTTVSNMDPGNNNFIWTLDNGTCSDSDTITIINNIATQADAGRDTIVCSTTLNNLAGNNNYDHFRETGFWRVVQGGATITDPSLFNSSVTNLDFYCSEWTPDWWTTVDAPNIFEWVIQRGGCESTDQVRVLNGIPGVVDAGVDQTVCDNQVNLDALDEGSCAHEVYWTSPASTSTVITFQDPQDHTNIDSIFFNNHVEDVPGAAPPGGAITQFIWHKINHFQDSGGNPIDCELTDTVEITAFDLYQDVQAGTNDAVCVNEYHLMATDPNSIFNTPPHNYYTTGQWSVTFGNGNFDDDTFYNTWVRNMAAYDNIYRWTIINHDLNCIMSDDVWIHSARPSGATAGPDDVICDDNIVLTSNVPLNYSSAYWTVAGGSATILGNSCTGFDCDAFATNIGLGTNIFVWHVENEYTGPHGGYSAGSPLICYATDTTIIINRSVIAAAGNDIYECGDFTQLFANDPGGESGLWTGSGTFESSGTNTSTLFNDVVHGLVRGKNTFTWTISNEACNGSDQVVVWGLLPPDPFANVDQTDCIGDVDLNANDVSDYWSVVDPVPPNPVWQEATATGYWTSNVMGVTFDNASNFSTTAHNVPANGATPTMFIWHSLNDFTDHVAGLDYQCELTDTMFYYNHAVTSVAGPDGQRCGIQGVGAVYTLGATPVTSPETGLWTTVFAPGATIVTPTFHNSQVTGMLNGDHEYRWTVSHWLNSHECTADDFVTVRVRIPTPVVVAPPSSYEICEDFTTLQANQPNYTIGETGLWTDINDPAATIVDPTSEVTMVTGIGLGTRMFEWRITNDFCDSTGIITVYNNMILADADDRIDEDAILHGVADNDSAVCQNWYDLSATDPNIYNTGTAPIPAGVWTALPGTVTFDNITLYNTTVRNLNDIGTNISNLTWTITKGGCVEASILDITDNEFPTDAHTDNVINIDETCTGDFTLSGEQAPAGGNGYWSLVSGGGSFQNPTLYNTLVTGVSKPFSVYQWNVTSLSCDAADQVTIYNNSVTSSAGFPDTVCVDYTNLNGGIPDYSAGETGQWFVSLGASTVTDQTAFNSGVTNMVQGQNRFIWRITNGNCEADDEVEIVNNEPDDFTVEPDKEVCTPNSSISVNPFPAYGTGIWDKLAGGASTTITNPSAINTAVTGLQPGSNIFRWTVNNLGCEKEDQIEITNNMVISEAGIAQDVCADSANLLAADPDVNFPFQGTGTWSVITGAATVVDITAFNSQVINLDPGLNTFRWTMSLGSCTDTDDADVTNNSVTADATDQISCDNTAVFDGNNPGSADGLWTLLGSSATPTIVTPTLNISDVNGLGFGINTFRWRVDNTAGCSDSIDIVIDNGYFIISAGSDQNNLCDNFSTLNGDEPGSGNPGISGNWGVFAGTGTVTNPTLYNSGVTGLSPGNNTFRWVVNSSICSAFDEVILINNSPTTAVITTPILANREICTNSAAVEGTNPVFGTGQWTVSTAGASFVDPTDYQTVVNNLDPGNNIITWTITNGACDSDDVITIINNEVTAVAGPDQNNLCADNTFLNATDPLIIYPFQGTGHWTNLSGNTAVLVNSMAENSQVTNLPIGTTVFQWTVEQGICFANSQVQITNNSVTASATDQADCTADFVLNGNDPLTFGGTGYWEIISGGGTITAPSTLHNTSITGVPNGTSTALRWTVDNGTCTDDIQISVENNTFSVSAGPDQTICFDNTTLNGDDPLTGSGYWTRLSGSGVFSNTADRNSAVTGIGQGTSVYTWTVTRNGCMNSNNVSITNNSPSDAVITGPLNTETCNGTAILTANLPAPYYADNQYWELVSGNVTFNNPSTSFTMNVSNLAPGDNIFKWAVERGACPDSEDFITITNNEVDAVAGSDQPNLCADNTFLNATDPSVIYPFQGTGYWTNLSGNSAIIANSLAENSAVSDLPIGLTTFQWTVEQGGCTDSDLVQITNSSVTATASDLDECDGDFILTGNDPATFGGSGYWEIISGSGTITAPSTLYNTTITGVSYSTTTALRWTVENGICSDDIQISVTNNNFNVNAGPNLDICTDNAVMNGDDPLSGTGYWTLLSGSGIFSNSTDRNATVTGIGQGTSVYTWTVARDGCINSGNVSVVNNSPSIALITGPLNTETCDGTAILTANHPFPYYADNQYWELVGGGATFNDPSSSFTMHITNLNPGNNIFKWAVERGSCLDSEDFITITNNEVRAEAGPPQILCANTTSLNATSPSAMYPFQGTGSWTTLVPGVIIDNSLLETTTVSSIPNGDHSFFWTVSLGSCDITDNVVISNHSVDATATDAQTCNSDIAALTGNNPAPGESGLWTCSTGSVTYDNQSLYDTGAHNLAVGNNTFVWTINNADCTDAAVITVEYIDPTAEAGPDQDICSDNTFLAGLSPAPGSGTWSVLTGTGNFVSPSNHNTFVTNIGFGANVYVWTVIDRICIESSSVTITNNLPVASAGSDLITCLDIATLPALQEQAGETGLWIKIGGSGIVTTPTLYNSQVTNLSSGVNTFQWTVDNGLCTNSDEVQIYNNEITSISAGVDRAICSSSTSLAALAPGTGETGSWDALSGSAIFDNSAFYNTGVSNLSQGDNILQWTLTNGTCSDSDNVTITNNSPTTPSTSPDAEICSSTWTLLANAPNTGVGETGLWTNEFGAVGVIVEPTDNITTVHSIGHGSNTFRWTISNALCDAYDDIVITNNTISTDAGLDQSRCSDTAVLAATNPAPGTGYWKMVNPLNGPVFDNSLAYNTVIRNLAQGNNILVWTATSGGCTAWDLVTISNDNPTIADAGIDQTVCNSTATLSGNNPSVGTGVWTRLGGAGVIANPSHNNTNVTGLSAGGNTFRWTVTEGSCVSYDDVLIMNELVYASAGIDDEICGDFYSELNGNQPGEGETGEWTVTGGSGVFAEATLYNTSVSGLSGAENRFTWTVSKGTCSNSDDVSIFDNTPSTASTGSDKEICDDYTVIAANPPAIGVGEWSVAAGTGDFDNSLANTTTVRNIVTEINIYRWTITNGICTSSADIAVTYNGVTAVVGDSIFECGTTTYLNGNEPQGGQTGIWTTTGPGVIIVNPTLYNTAVSDLNVGINKFRWTINFGICSDYADLVVTNDLYDANASVAGPTTICVDYADLLGNIPPPGATGEWSVWAGGGTFDDPASPTAEVTGLLRGENTLRWTITKNACSNYDDVVITNNMVTALTGNDIITCGNDPTLVANELYPGESGLWTKTAACGSSTILSPTTNETVVTRLCYGVNGFRWTVNGNGCSAWDEITVNENSFNIVAGFDQHVCDTTVELGGEDPAPGYGIWSFSGPGVTIVNPTLNTTVVNGLQDNSPHTFRWTVYKNGCSAWDEVIIYNDLVHANAGEDQSVCSPNAILSATEPEAGTGYWTISTGAGEVTDPTFHASTVIDLGPLNNTLIWTVTNLACFDSDDVTITNNMVTATAGPDQQICEDFTNLAGTPPQDGGYGIWETAGGTGIVQTPTAYNSYAYNLQPGINTFRWTVYENDCSNGGDLVQIRNNSFVADAGSDQILPLNQTYTNFDAELLPGQTGQWSIHSGSGDIAEYNSPTSYVDNMFTGENEFTWTVSEVINPSLTCLDTDIVKITVSDLDVQCGEDQINCVDTAKMNAEYETNVDPINHVWTVVNGSGVFDDIHDPKTVVRHIEVGTSIYRWTVYYTGFEVSCTVNITNDSIYVGAGDDAESCEDYHTMNAQQIVGGTGIWTVVGIGGGTIADNTLHNTEVTSIVPGTNRFEWYTKRTYSGCESRDTVELRYNLAPIPDFETDPTEFCAPAWVTIDNTSSNYGGWDEADVYEWSVIGDEGWFIGETYNVDEDIIEEFTNIGEDDSTYYIQLVAIDTITGCSDTIVHSITAFPGPKVEFTPSSHEKRFPDASFQFDNGSDEDLISYHWDFGDGENIYQADYVGYVDHEYGTWGTYIITLTGISGGQCDGEYIDTIVITPPCPDSYDVGSVIAKGCQPLTVEFNSNIHFADSIQWDFGDHSDLSNAENPLYTYEDYGEYIVIVNAWNKGCDEEAYERRDTVIVYPKPIVDFDVSPRLIMIPNQAIHCYNYSEFGNRYLWDFGDTVSFDKEPMHYYTVPGIYDITLSVWTEHDCFDSTLTKSMVFAEEPGMIRYPNAFTPNPNGSNGGVYPCTGNRIDTENLNDVFYPLFSGVVDYQLEIYNRWGEKIFITNDICIGWDGYVDGVMAPQDVYVWKVSVVYMNGEPYKEYGSVTLLR